MKFHNSLNWHLAPNSSAKGQAFELLERDKE